MDDEVKTTPSPIDADKTPDDAVRPVLVPASPVPPAPSVHTSISYTTGQPFDISGSPDWQWKIEGTSARLIGICTQCGGDVGVTIPRGIGAFTEVSWTKDDFPDQVWCGCGHKHGGQPDIPGQPPGCGATFTGTKSLKGIP